MALLVILLGLLLMGGGGFFVFLGFDIVMTERGAAMTMAGATALAGGAATLGLGIAVLRLTQILRALEVRPAAAAEIEAAVGGGRTAELATVGLATAGIASAVAVAGAAHPDASADKIAALTPATQPDIDAILVPGISAVSDEPQVAAAARPSSSAPIPTPDAFAAPEDDAPPDDPEPNLASTPEPKAAHDPEDQPDALPMRDGDDAEELSEAADDGPAASATVLGSYRAGGRTYTMFSDGSVEALTDSGVERFESMDALRSSLARS